MSFNHLWYPWVRGEREHSRALANKLLLCWKLLASCSKKSVCLIHLMNYLQVIIILFPNCYLWKEKTTSFQTITKKNTKPGHSKQWVSNHQSTREKGQPEHWMTRVSATPQLFWGGNSSQPLLIRMSSFHIYLYIKICPYEEKEKVSS